VSGADSKCPVCKGAGVVEPQFGATQPCVCMAKSRTPALDAFVATDKVLATEHIGRYFRFDHLPPNLQEVSQPFCALAVAILTTLPRNPERTVALRKLLEAKDCAVRALMGGGPILMEGDPPPDMPPHRDGAPR
jgi:hypothetical protein